ncbi:Ribonuclease H-like domain containing protein [Parasponia andersonii]|uniref:Ribonuclease H-like domain containing protein n=1 Tax=Parasponia andersonii TaxID=3476 RepID=A0A2P5BDA5_PARAD|nr:Ribonuclease H-like domain containing protein [Parasponia andersonii]
MFGIVSVLVILTAAYCIAIFIGVGLLTLSSPFSEIDFHSLSSLTQILTLHQGYLSEKKLHFSGGSGANTDFGKGFCIEAAGLTFSDEKGNLSPCGTDKYYIWQFNFHEFKKSEDKHAPDSIELLERSDIDYEKCGKKSVKASRFGELFTSSGVVMNDEVRCNTFHGGDFSCEVEIDGKVLIRGATTTGETIVYSDLQDKQHLLDFYGFLPHLSVSVKLPCDVNFQKVVKHYGLKLLKNHCVTLLPYNCTIDLEKIGLSFKQYCAVKIDFFPRYGYGHDAYAHC